VRARWLSAPASLGSCDELFGELTGCAGKPALDKCVACRSLGDDLELDEDGGIPIEMRNREEPARLHGEQRFLVPEVGYPNGDDRPSGGCTSAKRRRSALLKGRTHANALLATDHVRLP
jgi:hypothetical protein